MSLSQVFWYLSLRLDITTSLSELKHDGYTTLPGLSLLSPQNESLPHIDIGIGHKNQHQSGSRKHNWCLLWFSCTGFFLEISKVLMLGKLQYRFFQCHWMQLLNPCAEQSEGDSHTERTARRRGGSGGRAVSPPESSSSSVDWDKSVSNICSFNTNSKDQTWWCIYSKRP